MSEEAPPFNPPVILDGHGQPARPKNASCPKCFAPKSRRVVHHPFGQEPTEVCGACGYEFEGAL
jgi:rubredoxin